MSRLTPPPNGSPITMQNGQLVVPDNPIIPYMTSRVTEPGRIYGGPRYVSWMRLLPALMPGKGKFIGWKFMQAEKPIRS